MVYFCPHTDTKLEYILTALCYIRFARFVAYGNILLVAQCIVAREETWNTRSFNSFRVNTTLELQSGSIRLLKNY